MIFSSSFKQSEEDRNNKVGGLYSINAEDISGFNNAKPRELLALKSDIYAGRIISELDGEIIGFDTNTGGIRRSGVKTGFKNSNRDFTNYKMDITG